MGRDLLWLLTRQPKKCQTHGKLHRLGDADNLHLLVTEKGSKLWRFGYSAIEMAKRVKNHYSEIFQYGIAAGKCRRDPATYRHG